MCSCMCTCVEARGQLDFFIKLATFLCDRASSWPEACQLSKGGFYLSGAGLQTWRHELFFKKIEIFYCVILCLLRGVVWCAQWKSEDNFEELILYFYVEF